MKNGDIPFPNSTGFQWTNGTGATVAAGKAVKIGATMLGVLIADIANGATGAVETRGRFTFAATSAETWSQGDPLGFDFTAQKVIKDISGGVYATAASAKTNGQTTASVELAGRLREFFVKKNPSAGEDTANQMDVDTGFGVDPVWHSVVLRNAAGLDRPATVTLPSAGVIRIAEANLAATDVVFVRALG